MPDDLADANAAVDWAASYLPVLQKQIEGWASRHPYSFVVEDDPEMGKKLIKLRVDWKIPNLINGGVGAVIGSLRSSLDLLAAALATRNGIQANADCHFPFYPSHQDFIDPLNASKRKKWLKERDRIILERLLPYRGGDDQLFALHHLDIIRKHTRLIRVDSALSGVSASPLARAQGLTIVTPWPGFKDNAVVARTDINATECDFQITHDIAFSEGSPAIKGAVLPELRRLAELAWFTIDKFRDG